MELDYGEDKNATFNLLVSEGREKDDIFGELCDLICRPLSPLGTKTRAEHQLLNSDMLNICKRAAVQLAVCWPVAVAETTRCHYKGKRLPLPKSAMKKPLPIFPELLKEVACSWRDNPYSSRSFPIA